MELSRIKVLHCGVILQLLFVFASPLPYTKYGRTCSDIGCLSSQVCVMAYESCSIGQREGNDCGRYPTCKKNTDPSVSGGPSGVLSLNPAPENTKVVSGSKDSAAGYPSMAIDPNYIFGSVQSTRSPFFNNYPQPGAGSPAVFQPLYPPLNQPPVIPQAPFNFGASPHNPFYPQHPNPNPTSTEPSLWNQFLYNKQPDKRPRNAAPHSLTTSTSHTLLLALGAVVPFLYLRFGICRSSSVAL
uniref:Putative secreted peptide n=1 Tax=Anopheles braziliensis TaxID=58242 RepID=A0A2M3ZEE9_9DIPT